MCTYVTSTVGVFTVISVVNVDPASVIVVGNTAVAKTVVAEKTMLVCGLEFCTVVEVRTWVLGIVVITCEVATLSEVMRMTEVTGSVAVVKEVDVSSNVFVINAMDVVRKADVDVCTVEEATTCSESRQHDQR